MVYAFITQCEAARQTRTAGRLHTTHLNTCMEHTLHTKGVETAV